MPDYNWKEPPNTFHYHKTMKNSLLSIQEDPVEQSSSSKCILAPNLPSELPSKYSTQISKHITVDLRTPQMMCCRKSRNIPMASLPTSKYQKHTSVQVVNRERKPTKASLQRKLEQENPFNWSIQTSSPSQLNHITNTNTLLYFWMTIPPTLGPSDSQKMLHYL